MRYLVVFVMLFAVLCPMVYSQDGAKHVLVKVPQNWRDTRRIRLVFKDITAPANRAFKLRVSAGTNNADRVLLGSIAVEGVGRNKAGTHVIPVLRLDVTRTLRRLLETSPAAAKLDLFIETVEARGKSVKDIDWVSKSVLFETVD